MTPECKVYLQTMRDFVPEWDLFSSQEGVIVAAIEIQEEFDRLLEQGLDANEIYPKMITFMEGYSKFGATDSDCKTALRTKIHNALQERVNLDEFYG